ncbi:uncharacterized protein ARMOST_20870 [Armillaria ostoyae]|uniref:Uncharacterized protein n=1 Tax=Armillaria ostoyae TaxID=47428 RepID=A0A284S8H9_ARMOS|nr:uncharacterized protein ARMOST_20870 [Armillaria ostoyae]
MCYLARLFQSCDVVKARLGILCNVRPSCSRLSAFLFPGLRRWHTNSVQRYSCGSHFTTKVGGDMEKRKISLVNTGLTTMHNLSNCLLLQKSV